MPDYNQGKIYAIRSYLTDKIYIGSTCDLLHKRLYGHKKDNERDRVTKSKEIIDLGDAYIELIENYPCKDRNELVAREGHHIRSNNCVNKKVEGRTRKEIQKAYNDANKEKRKELNKQYRLKQKTTI
jgi:hypothetical protein